MASHSCLSAKCSLCRNGYGSSTKIGTSVLFTISWCRAICWNTSM